MNKHLKRLNSPKLWKIPRKTKYWVVKPRPGPHSLKKSNPLLVLIRDVLNFADTHKEAKKMIKNGKVLIDQKICKDPKFPVGLMDTISFPDLKKNFRIFIKKNIEAHEISEEEAKIKLCKIIRKKAIKGGKIQLGLHDGRTIVLNSKKTEYNVSNTLSLNLPDQEIKEYIKLKEDNYGIIIGGKLAGNHGKITDISKEIVTIENEKTYRTPKKYVMMVGKEEPIISLPK